MSRKLAPATLPTFALTAKRAAATLDVGPDFFAEHVAPELRVVRRGTKKLYPVTELERWVADNAERPVAEEVA